ncbi:hypothetical protein D9615_007060 [Tricholomella constricta]|uniref:Uncharacterized protein n=1 Tax=Tricholomella constricta TaxID=117010 RepID=A0A8H5M2G0_9AGAR|nr:hypothetical protein D9615_007060 [Tricholomella constricta]
MYNSLYSTRLSRLSSRRGPPPSSAQVLRAAATAISTLSEAGVTHACFVGGMACKLFGNARDPNVSTRVLADQAPSSALNFGFPTYQDIDILCLTTEWEQEALKRKLVSLNSSFYLVAARSPLATYKVLWFRFADTDSCVKVDLLFPGVLGIPSIPASSITTANAHKLPCAPFALVLLLKLQAWVHHGEALEYRFRQKQLMDARDITLLLPIACSMNIRPCATGTLPKAFLELSAGRAEKFVRHAPSSRPFWELLRLIKTEKKAVEGAEGSSRPLGAAKEPAKAAPAVVNGLYSGMQGSAVLLRKAEDARRVSPQSRLDLIAAFERSTINSM